MSLDVITDTDLPLRPFRKGKVRDLYDLGDSLLVISTDRISAFDVVLPTGIPCKGEALNRLSVYWFNQTKDIISNHILEVIDPRTLVVQKARSIKIEFVVRGYLYGSAWRNYRNGKPISGRRLPNGLEQAEKLTDPILTPTTKAIEGHDMEITHQTVVEKIGKDLAEEACETCLRVYERGSRRAEVNGIIVADTKMEFGTTKGELVLIDELLTPDSSRFWPKKGFKIGGQQLSFDKQFVRDYLISIGWNKQPPAPGLPEHIVSETSRKYVEAYERLTGRKF
jgi:phosphoribosylaminoimidazole-succinocarboxamide synthase